MLGVDPPVRASSPLRLFLAIAFFAMAGRRPPHICSDTWFNLVLGRDIAEAGLVTKNELTRVGFGVHLADQQWLAHWILYGMATEIGLPGVALANAVLTAGSILAALGAALRGGATHGRTLVVGVLALAAMISHSMARAQSLALPFIAALFIVLLRDQTRPQPRTWLFVPCVAVWANLHGSVLLAPLFAALATVTRMIDAHRHEKIAGAQVVRDIGLTLAFGGAAFASPYAFELPQYYRATFANPLLFTYLPEWAPPTLAAAPAAWCLILVVAAIAIYRLRVAPAFESAGCLVLAAATLGSVRHAVPLALFAALVLPRMLDGVLPDKFLRFVEDRPMRLAARALFPLAIVAFGAIPISAWRWLRRDAPTATTDRAAAAARPDRLVFTDESQGDRLLWFHPELRGRISYDARAETMTASDLDALASLYGMPNAPQYRRLLEDYDVVVADHDVHPEFARSMDQDPGWEKIGSDSSSAVFARRK
jgi:hypothetical protein